MREVIPGKLWIGNAGDARDISRVLSFGITAVINLAIEEPPVAYPRDITYCRFPLLDGSGNPAAKLHAAITTAGNLIKSGTPTLMTCGGGMSRAPTIAAAALAHATGISLQQALADVLGTGPRDVAAGLLADVQAVIDNGQDRTDGSMVRVPLVPSGRPEPALHRFARAARTLTVIRWRTCCARRSPSCVAMV